MNGAATLIPVNVGLAKDLPWAGRTVRTGIVKSPVPGPVTVRRLNLDGDGQGDLNGHGGEQRAAARAKGRARTAPTDHMPMVTAPAVVTEIVLDAVRAAATGGF